MRSLLIIGLISLIASSASADWPRWAHRVNQFNRYFGTGWSDGYHSCHYESRSFGADMPPAPEWLRHRWAHPEAMQGIITTHPVASPDFVEGLEAPRPSEPLQQPASPLNSSVPPSILEEIRQYERQTEQREAIERDNEEQAEFDDFLGADDQE